MELSAPFVAPELIAPRGSYSTTLERLNRGSVEKHYDAYGDVAWNAPESRIDPTDPVWELHPEDDGIALTDWYRNQSPEMRRRIGLDVICNFMRIGAQFETILVRGLLDFAQRFPDGAPERRYIMHEAVEECQHIQMFREFINRSGLDVRGLPDGLRLIGRGVASLGRIRPPLFLVFVMGGEDPIDYVQRKALRNGRPLHPLLRQVMQFHVTEEARHLCFARMYLAEEVRTWSSARRHMFGLASAPILNIMSRIMLRPTAPLVKRYDIPRAALAEAYEGEQGRAQTMGSVAKIRELFREHGIFTRDVEIAWRRFGLA